MHSCCQVLQFFYVLKMMKYMTSCEIKFDRLPIIYVYDDFHVSRQLIREAMQPEANNKNKGPCRWLINHSPLPKSLTPAVVFWKMLLLLLRQPLKMPKMLFHNSPSIHFYGIWWSLWLVTHKFVHSFLDHVIRKWQ